jgi:hypothetical protein
MARMKTRVFERVASRCELLDAKAAYEILGITKQALSQKTKAGKLLAYTDNWGLMGNPVRVHLLQRYAQPVQKRYCRFTMR